MARNSPRAPLQPVVSRVLTPFREFAHLEASGGILLFVAAVVALAWANSPWSEAYFDLWHAEVTVQAGRYSISESLSHWINDGLMAVFFFVVGLEIKREVLVGELAAPRRAALPIGAAIGGAIVPAAIYVALNAGGVGARGWGVPMATDIAFALGVLAILGSRVPTGLKVFLTALAIVDDILAVLVIALFYTDAIDWDALLLGTVILALLVGANLAHIRQPVVYFLLGVALWLAFLDSGVHATVAGVLLALTIPARTRIDSAEFLIRTRAVLDDFERAGEYGANILTNVSQRAAVQDLETAAEDVQAPSQRLEHVLHPWVAYLIVPLFALANAGVEIGDNLGDALRSEIALGILLGLVVGKQAGILLAAWLLVRGGLSSLPEGTSWRQVHGAACVAGIGFTMSLFIADLAFLDAQLLATAKVGILAASVVSGSLGWALLRRAVSSSSPMFDSTR
jgi:NhaA family Na+:H+ antiporter